MPYLHSTLTREEAAEDFVIKRRIDAETLAKAKRVEVWCSAYSDPGPDYSIIKIFDGENRLIHTARVEGY